ncbi:hypothetical protein QOT17_004890 [Balamuthia mandrillaris]
MERRFDRQRNKRCSHERRRRNSTATDGENILEEDPQPGEEGEGKEAQGKGKAVRRRARTLDGQSDKRVSKGADQLNTAESSANTKAIHRKSKDPLKEIPFLRNLGRDSSGSSSLPDLYQDLEERPVTRERRASFSKVRSISLKIVGEKSSESEHGDLAEAAQVLEAANQQQLTQSEDVEPSSSPSSSGGTSPGNSLLHMLPSSPLSFSFANFGLAGADERRERRRLKRDEKEERNLLKQLAKQRSRELRALAAAKEGGLRQVTSAPTLSSMNPTSTSSSPGTTSDSDSDEEKAAVAFSRYQERVGNPMRFQEYVSTGAPSSIPPKLVRSTSLKLTRKEWKYVLGIP